MKKDINFQVTKRSYAGESCYVEFRVVVCLSHKAGLSIRTFKAASGKQLWTNGHKNS